MAKKKPKPQFFTTVSDMRAVPGQKIDAFCEDLRLWLHMHAQVVAIRSKLGDQAHLVQITTPVDAFGWIDDDRHDANINIHLKAEGR